MTSKYNKPNLSKNSRNSIYGTDIPEDFYLPSCGIEDVDRAVYNLFNKDLPLFFKSNNGIERVPVNFPSGERAFIRDNPYMDETGAIILPIISVLKSGIKHEATAGGFGVGPGTGEIEISRRKFKDSIEYFNEKNKEGLTNQENVSSENKHFGISTRDYRSNISDIYIQNELSSPVTEIISIPSPRYFSATYEITFWTQYLQQMNSLLEAFLSSYVFNPVKSFKLESEKGYWFVGFVEDFNEDFNFDSMTDEERILKYTFNISVNAYIINPVFPGSQSTVRRTISVPKIHFDTKFANMNKENILDVPSGYPKDYTNSDIENDTDPLPGSSIGRKRNNSYGINQNTTEEDIENTTPINTSIGGTEISTSEEYTRIENYFNPITNKVEQRKVLVKTKTARFGESVHIIIPIGN